MGLEPTYKIVQGCVVKHKKQYEIQRDDSDTQLIECMHFHFIWGEDLPWAQDGLWKIYISVYEVEENIF